MNTCMCACVGGGYLAGGPSKILFEGLSSAMQCGEWACPGQKAFTFLVQRGGLGPPAADCWADSGPGSQAPIRISGLQHPHMMG